MPALLVKVASGTRSRGVLALTALVLAVTSGCAERRLITSPTEGGSGVSTGTWIAVWSAGVVIAVVLGVLLTLPVWQASGGARFAASLLTVEAGAVALVSLLLVGVAVRSWQLLDRPVDAAPVAALVRLSRADGDTGYYALMVLVSVLLGGLLVTLLAVGARFARSCDPVERTVASAVLAVQLGACAFLTVRLALGDRGWPYLGAALGAPLVIVALATCWPVRAPWVERDGPPSPTDWLRDSRS